MSAPPAILLCDRDPRSADVFHAVLQRERGLRLLVAQDRAEAESIAEREHPLLVAAAFEALGVHAFELCRKLKADPWSRGLRFLLILESGAVSMRASAHDAGVDDTLMRPLDPVALQARVRDMMATHALLDEWRAEQHELARLRHELEHGGTQAVELLSSVLDMCLPGGAARGLRDARVAERIAERFGVPAHLRAPLEIAARLHELGRIAGNTHARDSRAPTDAWQFAVTTRAMLFQLDPLRDAAQVVGAMYENWDGSGHPDHLIQGQIPLRSRILRAVSDYHAALGTDDPERRADVVESFFGGGGAFYDPLVLVHLRTVVEDEGMAGAVRDRLRVPVEALKAGMVLAEDLATDNGIKLLARGTVLSTAALDVIRRRHQTDPIVRGVVVKRAA